MNKTVVVIAATLIFMTAIAAVVILTVTDHDATLLIGFLTSAIIPTVASLFAYREAAAARKNTNGLLHDAQRRASEAETKLAEKEQASD